MEKLFSTAELARLWNVSESTVKRWTDAGDLTCIKTPGGHRRFTFDEVSRFQRAQGFEAVGRLVRAGDDETGAGVPELERALERPDLRALAAICFRSAVAGDSAGVSAVFARAYLRGVAPVDLYDRILTPAMHHVGDSWLSGELTVADEHLATRTVLDAVVRLQPEFRQRAPNGRVAVVGCPEDEIHDVAAGSTHHPRVPNLPYRNASVGRRSRLRAVEVKRPPRITVAMGPSISRPGSPLPIASGRSPSAVTRAVMRIGTSRSDAPRIAASIPQVSPSTATRCS